MAIQEEVEAKWNCRVLVHRIIEIAPVGSGVLDVRKRLTGNVHRKRPHVREVRLAHLARTMRLLEVDLPLRTLQRPPPPESTLQRA